MAGEIGTAYVAVKLDPTGIRQGLAATEAETTKRSGLAGKNAGKAFSAGMKVGMVGLAAVGVAMVKSVGAASDLNEEVNKTNVVFADSADKMLKWSKTSATAMGLSQQEALAAAGGYGNMFKTIGLGDADAAKMSRTMTQLAGDMASFSNEAPTDMLDKLRSGLSGEAEPLRRFGVLISEATVNQFAYRNGIAKSGKKLTEAQKVQARYGVIMEQTTKAQGDFARTSDGLANKQRIMRAQVKNLSAQLGSALLPIATDIVGVFSDMAGIMSKYPTASKVVVAAVAGISAALVIANVAWKVYTAVTTEGTFASYAASVAMRVLSASMYGIPVIAIAAGIIAIGVALVYAYKKSETFRRIVDATFAAFKAAVSAVVSFVKNHWQTMLAILVGPVALAALLIIRHWDQIKDAFGSLVDAVKNGWNAAKTFLSGLPSKALELGKRVGSAIVDGILDAFRDIGQRIKNLIPDPSSLIPDIPGISGHLAAPPTGGGGAPAPVAAGVGVSALAGGGAGGLAGPVPLGARLRRAVRGARPSVELAAAPRRAALTITNWHDGTGYFELVADGSVQHAGRLVESKRRMTR